MSSNHILSCSGWGQPYDALLPVIPHATMIDYMRYGNIADVFAMLSTLECDSAVGWSLGGQVLLRAIAAKVIQPKFLVLIATPFCFSHPDSETFLQRVMEDPASALKRFNLMMCEKDSKRKEILRNLPQASPSPHLVYWLKELYNFKGETVDFHALPPTLILQGGNDSIVPLEQATMLAERIPQVQVVIYNQAAHMPHLHDSDGVCKIIKQYLDDKR